MLAPPPTGTVGPYPTAGGGNPSAWGNPVPYNPSSGWGNWYLNTPQPQTTITPPSIPGTPDPSSWVESILGPLRAELAGESAQDYASAKAGIQRALVQGGFTFDPKQVSHTLGFGIPKSFFDNRTQQLINEGNTAGLSQNFRINQANDDARRAIINNLAARGIVRGGSTGYQLGRQNTAYTQAQYGARQHILDAIASTWSQYLQAERQRAMQLAQAGMAAGAGH